MKSLTKLFFFICVTALLLTSCANSKVSSSTHSETTNNFPENIEETSSNKFLINAQCIYPSNFKPGIAKKAELGEGLFWDKQDEIVDLFFGKKDVEKEYLNEYDTSKDITFLTDSENTMLQITDNNYIVYNTQQALYIQNVINTDDNYESYNGDKYQKITDLDFMTQDEAWKTVKEFMEKLNVEVSDSYVCYVMDHNTMETEENRLANLAESLGEKTPQMKGSWTPDDDSYYFLTRTCWEGYPVLPQLSGEGIDENNVIILVNANGIISLSISGYYPLKLSNETEIQSPNSVIPRLQTFLSNIISNDTYELESIELCQKATGIDFKKHTANIIPVWKCNVLVTNAESNDSYIQTILFNAETLENVQ